MKLQKISLSEFTWEKWGGRYFGLDSVFNIETGIPNTKRFNFLGYVLSKDLHIRPRTSGKAVMLFDKEAKEECWIHFPEHTETKLEFA